MTSTPTRALRPVTPVALALAAVDDLAARIGPGGPGEQEVRDALRHVHDLLEGLESYTARCTSEPSPGLQALQERTLQTVWEDGTTLEPEMLSGHVEGALLALLVAATGARRVLEIGMFTGYSALAMAQALPQDGELVACEIDAGVAQIAQDAFDRDPAGARVRIALGPAQRTLEELADAGEAFDLIFLDADKTGYPQYVRTVLDRGLLAAGGLLCIDNTLYQGQTYGPEPRSDAAQAIAEVNAALVQDGRVEQVLLPVRDGLTLARLR